MRSTFPLYVRRRLLFPLKRYPTTVPGKQATLPKWVIGQPLHPAQRKSLHLCRGRRRTGAHGPGASLLSPRLGAFRAVRRIPVVCCRDATHQTQADANFAIRVHSSVREKALFYFMATCAHGSWRRRRAFEGLLRLRRCDSGRLSVLRVSISLLIQPAHSALRRASRVPVALLW
jgi:hypothetical protein